MMSTQSIHKNPEIHIPELAPKDLGNFLNTFSRQDAGALTEFFNQHALLLKNPDLHQALLSQALVQEQEAIRCLKLKPEFVQHLTPTWAMDAKLVQINKLERVIAKVHYIFKKIDGGSEAQYKMRIFLQPRNGDNSNACGAYRRGENIFKLTKAGRCVPFILLQSDPTNHPRMIANQLNGIAKFKTIGEMNADFSISPVQEELHPTPCVFSTYTKKGVDLNKKAKEYDRLNAEKRLANNQFRLLLVDFIFCIHKLHNQQHVHNDIKPHNALFFNQGSTKITRLRPRVVLIDFDGCMKEGTVATPIITSSYAAPEAQNFEARAVAKSDDIWSLGVTLYSLIYDNLPSIPFKRTWWGSSKIDLKATQKALPASLASKRAAHIRDASTPLLVAMTEIIFDALNPIPERRPTIQALLTKLFEIDAVRAQLLREAPDLLDCALKDSHLFVELCRYDDLHAYTEEFLERNIQTLAIEKIA